MICVLPKASVVQLLAGACWDRHQKNPSKTLYIILALNHPKPLHATPLADSRERGMWSSLHWPFWEAPSPSITTHGCQKMKENTEEVLYVVALQRWLLFLPINHVKKILWAQLIIPFFLRRRETDLPPNEPLIQQSSRLLNSLGLI